LRSLDGVNRPLPEGQIQQTLSIALAAAGSALTATLIAAARTALTAAAEWASKAGNSNVGIPPGLDVLRLALPWGTFPWDA
jgi:hypothetical protein